MTLTIALSTHVAGVLVRLAKFPIILQNHSFTAYSDPDYPPIGKLAERCATHSVRGKSRMWIRVFFSKRMPIGRSDPQ